MGSQMFSPQENEPRGPEERQANTDPREQKQRSTRRHRSRIPRPIRRMIRDIGDTMRIRRARSCAQRQSDFLKAMDLDHYCRCRDTCYRGVSS